MKKIFLFMLIFLMPFVVSAEELKLELQKSFGGNGEDDIYGLAPLEDGSIILYGSSDSTDIEGLPNKGARDIIIIKSDKEGNVLWQKSWGGNDDEYFIELYPLEDGGFLLYGYSFSTDIEGLPNKGGQDAIIVKYDKDGNMLWQTSWGGNDEDFFDELYLLNDGGFLLHGYSDSTDIEGILNKGGRTEIIVKYDKDGKLMWQNSWGGNDADVINGLYPLENGDFLLHGWSDSTDMEGLPNKGDKDAIIVKYDKDGNMIWQNSWGGNESDFINEFYLLEDGSFLLYGYSYSTDIAGLPNKGSYDAIIVKYDKDGKLLWQNSWGGNDKDFFYKLYLLEDGGFLLHGFSYSTDIEGLPNKGDRDAIIVKYDKDGKLLWQNSWGGNEEDSFEKLYLLEDGSFLLYGDSYSTDIEGLPNKGARDAIILKYDKDGKLIWQNSWGGNDDDYFEKLYLLEDGGFLLYGDSYSTDIEGLPNKGSGDVIIVKYDKDGKLLWQNSWGGNDDDYFEKFYLLEDGSFLLYGDSYSTDIEGLPNKGASDAIIVKYDKDGKLLWQNSWGGNAEDFFDKLYLLEDGSFWLYAYSYSTDIEGLPNKGEYDRLMVKYFIEFDLEMMPSENGSGSAVQNGKYGIITSTPNEGYEVDKIIIKDKDGNALDVEVIKLENGTYSFELYTDVIVEVLFKEELVNPKTGVIDYVLILLGTVTMSLMLYFTIIKYESKNNINLGM